VFFIFQSFDSCYQVIKLFFIKIFSFINRVNNRTSAGRLHLLPDIGKVPLADALLIEDPSESGGTDDDGMATSPQQQRHTTTTSEHPPAAAGSA